MYKQAIHSVTCPVTGGGGGCLPFSADDDGLVSSWVCRLSISAFFVSRSCCRLLTSTWRWWWWLGGHRWILAQTAACTHKLCVFTCVWQTESCQTHVKTGPGRTPSAETAPTSSEFQTSWDITCFWQLHVCTFSACFQVREEGGRRLSSLSYSPVHMVRGVK